MKYLVIAAHPDDEVLGCGGTISRLSSEGNDIYLMILGEGITSRYEKREDAPIDSVNEIKTTSHQVAALLGIKNVFFLNLPDNRFDTIPMLDIVKIIEKTLHDIQPDSVFTHHGGDLNLDHAIVSRATIIASRPVKDVSVTSVYSYEVPSSTDWAFQKFEPTFMPNVFYDITDTLEKKIQAMQLYDSENRQYPHPRSSESLRAIAARWGCVIGVNAAEAFHLIRYLYRK